MDADLHDSTVTAHATLAPPISSFVAPGRKSHGGRGHNTSSGRGGRNLPHKCSACGSLSHIMSSCTTSDDALLKWTLAKRKMIIQKCGTPNGFALAHVALISDVPTDDPDVMPTLEECKDEYDDTEVSVPFSSIAFSSSLAHGRDLSMFWVIESACSFNLTAFRSDFGKVAPPSAPSRDGGVDVDVKGGGTVRISILLASGHVIHCTVHALHTPNIPSRSDQRTGRLLIVSWMQSHSGYQFVFLTDSNIGLLIWCQEKWAC
jgi:hypothetical protein